MKKYMSLWMLWARNAILPLLILMALAAALQAGFLLGGDNLPYVEYAFSDRLLKLMAGVVTGCWAASLLLSDLGAAGSTLERLRISPRAVYWNHIAFNSLAFLLLWAFEGTLLFILATLYGRGIPDPEFGPQAVMLAFYRVPLLHGLIPLADWPLWIRNVLLCTVLGSVTAWANMRRTLPAMLLAGGIVFSAIVGFPAPLNGVLSNSLFFGVFALLITLLLLLVWEPHYGEVERHED